MRKAKVVGYCDIIVKNKKIELKSNLPKQMLWSLVGVLVEKYDLDTEEGLTMLHKTRVTNAKFHLTLDEDSIITFKPILNKTDVKRFISVVTSLYEEEKKNESSFS